MTGKEFLNTLANGKSDAIQAHLKQFEEQKIAYCVIGGLAVNVYPEPVASLDIDIALAVNEVETYLEKNGKYFKITKFPHNINLLHPDPGLRIQIQTDSRYQAFIGNTSLKNVLGYEMRIAALENVLKEKLWAYSDKEKRKSKRQKDLADIIRLVEKYPSLVNLIPEEIRTSIEN